ncbi:hypothetical protein [Agrococcus sp. SGAir0287]|uniref:hypothetical protein n=1 Tax=Agrococcus sp. SGAir0287 TaxID=2070347 RepID=UPI0010CD15C6|nr:hypothetical protein [Agrococcus sp. SGAir0287]QCR18916.1 hypothetical protein C1N71_05190 [Agrococcus sp. SGAir0287]
MSRKQALARGTRVVAVLDIGGLDRPFVPRGTTGVLEEATSPTTSLVLFDGIGPVDVDDDVEFAAAR